MSKLIKVESEDLSFEVFASARVPLLYQKKYGAGILKDAENLLTDAEKSVFLVYQCYLAKCRLVEEKPEITEDKILDFVPAVEIIKTAFKLITTFSNEITSLTEEKDAEKKT
jgi:hypothetical protein